LLYIKVLWTHKTLVHFSDYMKKQYCAFRNELGVLVQEKNIPEDLCTVYMCNIDVININISLHITA